MLCVSASKFLILISRITLGDKRNTILDHVLENKKCFNFNFFCDRDGQKLPLSTYETMVVPQSVSRKPSFYDKWLESYDVLRQFYSHERDLGGLLAPKTGNSPKPIFFEVFGCLSEF